MRDRADFERYVEQRSARLLRTAYLLCRDWGTAEDPLQTALAKAWLAWRRVGDDPDPYVYRTINMLIEGMDDDFEGWEAQLSEAEPFPLKWSVSVREVIFPVCRDNVRRVDPRTGKVVLLRCEGEATAPPSVP
ncbi:hypothetical protein OG884_03410 [Streptosporangium sp. NBC_01755]|uniref:sigma factor n=1 Tax=Streptosporangium sp. NBC_01755 TaxID=2975949 RepID=UPI002DD93C83|nr:sigma factor [Streptosporangium sp. NBC_01755]WSD01001.1 hypothetical protein OG884_03410 [Streptosporangium sp. NBC_01755]